MNPIHFDLTLVIQAISFLIVMLFICGIIYIFAFARKRQYKDVEIAAKLDRIIELLENEKKNR